MKTFTVSLLALCLLPVYFPFAENMMEQSLKQLEASPPLCEDVVDFVVCTDPQPGGFLGTPKVFLDMIGEWNVLRPDFIACAGDMIMGGPAAEVNPMWDEFVGRIETLDVPFFPVAGNHDVMDEAEVYRIYEERIAPLYYSFSYGSVQCIILNTEEPGDPDNFSPEQNNWLRSVLQASKAKHIFVFLHSPFFISNWERDWQPTADILKDYPVRAVFAGHLHYYRDLGDIQGIRYVVSGSAGGGIDTPEEEGGFFCYLAVKVRGDEVSWSVMKPHAVLPADTVTESKVQRMRELRGMLSGETVPLPWEAAMDRDVAITLANPFEAPLHAALDWTIPTGWQVTPTQLVFDVAPGQSVVKTVHFKTEGPARFPAPTLEGNVDNPETGTKLSLSLPLDLVPSLTIPHATGKVTLDGNLSEWDAAQPMAMNYGVSCNPADVDDLKASTRFMWDEENLYVAVEVEDNEFHQPYYGDVIWMADSVELWIDNSNWSFSLTEKGPQVFLFDRPDKHLDAITDAVPLAVHRDGRKVVYEAAYPKAELPQIAFTAGNTIRFSLLVNDLDPNGPLKKRHWVEVTPGAGEHFKCPMVALTFSSETNN